MKIKITTFKCDDNGIVSCSENVSDIIDKMIQLAAKVTERWASDIVYDINELTDAIKNKESIDKILERHSNDTEVIEYEFSGNI